MPLLDTIQTDMVAAMRAKEEAKLGALRMIKTALKKHEIDSMKPLDEASEMQIMNMLMKQRRESADMFRKGDRPELADKEEAELKLIESYLPASASDEDIDAAIASAMAETGAASAKQMGLVMKAAQAKLAGKRVDGKALSGKVKEKFGGVAVSSRIRQNGVAMTITISDPRLEEMVLAKARLQGVSADVLVMELLSQCEERDSQISAFDREIAGRIAALDRGERQDGAEVMTRRGGELSAG